MSNQKHPVRGSVYTMKQIDTELALRDTPFLHFYDVDGEKQVVQTAHNNIEDLSNYEEWANIRFTFVRETDEWIPLFNVVEDDNEKLLQLLDSGEDKYGETLYWPRALGSYL